MDSLYTVVVFSFLGDDDDCFVFVLEMILRHSRFANANAGARNSNSPQRVKIFPLIKGFNSLVHP